VLELASYFSRAKRAAGAPELRFVLFDGEECDGENSDFYNCGLRGSRAYARKHAKELRAVIVLDFVAQKELRIPRDDSSDLAMWSRLRRAAKRVGSGAAFPDETQGTVLDDHTPFLRAGVPAIDLIDFDFACWHQPCDDLTAVSRSSLDKSGEAVLELLRTWR
jgi:Zn-dependent M28 family amino/carboxypeptidase